MVEADFSMGANASRAVGRKVCHCSGGAVSRHGRRVVSGVSVCQPPLSLPRYLMSLLTPLHPLTRRTCATTSSIPICASSLLTLLYSATFSSLQRIPYLTATPVSLLYNKFCLYNMLGAFLYNSKFYVKGLNKAAVCIFFLEYSFTSSEMSTKM